jgi:hypothetical protein
VCDAKPPCLHPAPYTGFMTIFVPGGIWCEYSTIALTTAMRSFVFKAFHTRCPVTWPGSFPREWRDQHGRRGGAPTNYGETHVLVLCPTEPAHLCLLLPGPRSRQST